MQVVMQLLCVKIHPQCVHATSVTYIQALTQVRNGLSQSSAAQMSTAANRFLEAIGKPADSPIGSELLESYEQSLQALYAYLKAKGRADATYASVASRIGTLRTATLKLIANASLPPDFPGALTAAVVRSPYSHADIELRFGTVVQKWRLGQNLPAERSIPTIRALEEFLGIPGGLISRLPHLIGHASMVVERDPSDLLPKDFGQCLNTLRRAKGHTIRQLTLDLLATGQPVAHGSISRWELDRVAPRKVSRKVIAAIEKILEASGQLLRRYDRGAATEDPFSPLSMTAKPYACWNQRLETEFEHLAWFKSASDLPENLKRNKEGEWTRPASKKIIGKNLGLFFGYCHLPAKASDPMMKGAGLAPADLGFALLLNYGLVKGFCDFRKGRNAQQAYNASTVSFIAGLRNLVHADTGYFTQFPDRFCHHPLIQALLPSDITVTVLGRKETRALAHPHERFVALCGQVYEKANEFLQRLTVGGEARQTRDPSRRIKKILAEDQPLEPLLVLRERMEAVMSDRVNRNKRAKHITDIALVALMNIKPLRVSTLSELRENEIFRDKRDGSWRAAVPKERFKNSKFGARDGWFGEIHKSAWPALDRYWDQARPFLTFGASCDRFWVNSYGAAFIHNVIYVRFLSFTKRFLSDMAPDGVNPHAWRKVVSNDNLKSDRLNAIIKSAQQLNDLPKTIAKSYAMDSDQLRNDWVNDQTDRRLHNRKP